jgi:DNA-directed RNA polymerase subunit beta'
VILGHLIPAGTGFRTFQDSEIQYNLEAMRQMSAAPTQPLEASFPLLDSANSGSATAAPDLDFGADAGESSHFVTQDEVEEAEGDDSVGSGDEGE